MNTLSSILKGVLSLVHIRNQQLSARLKTQSGVSLGLLVVILCAAPQPSADAQQQPAPQQPERPFIEPAEMRHKMARRAAAETHPDQTGQWQTLPVMMPINPVHVALTHHRKVLVIAGSGNDPDNKNFQAGVWNPQLQTMNTFPITWDMFCNGMVILPDGRPFVLGGTLRYDAFLGEPRTAVFDMPTAQFVDTPGMTRGRWYPTGTVLGNGSVLVVSGLSDTSSTINTSVQIWNGSSWTNAGTIFPGVPLYPRQHLLPSGKVFESGANPNSKMYDPATQLWTDVARTILVEPRDAGTSVLLPLNEQDGFKPRVMILGGRFPTATDTTELIDLSVNQPQWVNGPRMARPRIQLNATLLPNGKVLVSGGSVNDEDAATATLQAELYDPDANSLSAAGTMEFPRLYHSNAILLPDATVMALGGNPQRGVFEPHIEIYSPPYLFNSDGSPAKRPVITRVTPEMIYYRAPVKIYTPDAAYIKAVVLVRPGAVTHAFDMEQRLVRLSFTAGNGVLNVAGPPNGNVVPPGYYMIFILNSSGVPSEGRFVRLR